ncbi:hypothetical protein D3C87_1836510 [compost metagenome]
MLSSWHRLSSGYVVTAIANQQGIFDTINVGYRIDETAFLIVKTQLKRQLDIAFGHGFLLHVVAFY